jgi:general secretion pathway protein A
MYPTSINNGLESGPIEFPAGSSAKDQSEQFLRHFGFRESPFGVTPNPTFLFSSRMHRAALQSMIHSIESNLGFTVLLGAPGMGKTTLLLQLLTQYRDSARTAFIFQTQCNRYELLRFLASELELPITQRDEVALHLRLKEMLVNEARAGRKVLIFIDEAQNLRRSSLEAIRLLSDFETARAKLLHIILAGSARLGETLLAPELLQLAQRISTVCRLEPLTPEEVNGYVTFRLGVAGCRVAEHLFSPEALAEVAEQSEGIPRVVNSICYRALFLAYAGSERRIGRALARQAATDLDLLHPSSEINSCVLAQLRRTENPAGPSPKPISSEEKHAFLDAKASSADLPAGATEEMQFRPAVLSAVVDSVEQPASTQQQGKAVPEALLKKGCLAEAARTKRYSAQHANLRFEPGSITNARSTLVLAAFILLALGLGAGWYELRVKAGTSVQDTTAVKPIVNPTEDKEKSSLLSDLAQLHSPTATAKSNASPADRKLIGGNKTQAPIVKILPQDLVPSKVRPQPADPIEEAAPAATWNISKIPNNLTSPVGTIRRPLPAPPEPSAQAAIAAIAEPTMTNESTDKYQTSLRQPIKVIQPKYPKLAELRHIEGEVLLELQVDSRGRVQTVRTFSGNPLLREAAEEAARQWQYPSFPENQPPVSSVTRIRFNFKLKPETKR